MITKEEFLRKSVSKNHSSISSESESKANIAFKIFDENHDGFITEKEMRDHSKITKTQVNPLVSFLIDLITKLIQYLNNELL